MLHWFHLDFIAYNQILQKPLPHSPQEEACLSLALFFTMWEKTLVADLVYLILLKQVLYRTEVNCAEAKFYSHKFLGC